MIKLSKNKAINALANKLITEDGWILHKKGASPHNKLMHPTLRCSYPIPATPSCPRAEKNWFAGIRRMQRGLRP